MIKETVEFQVEFYDVDSMQVAWHGNYVKYFEDARIAFGEKFNIGYLDIFAQGYYAPTKNMS